MCVLVSILSDLGIVPLFHVLNVKAAGRQSTAAAIANSWRGTSREQLYGLLREPIARNGTARVNEQ